MNFLCKLKFPFWSYDHTGKKCWKLTYCPLIYGDTNMFSHRQKCEKECKGQKKINSCYYLTYYIHTIAYCVIYFL